VKLARAWLRLRLAQERRERGEVAVGAVDEPAALSLGLGGQRAGVAICQAVVATLPLTPVLP
jgi:hypothetical protein